MGLARMGLCGMGAMNSDVDKAITVLREHAEMFEAVHDIAPLSSLGEHLAASVLRKECVRLDNARRTTPHRDCRYFRGLVPPDAISCAEFDEPGERFTKARACEGCEEYIKENDDDED